jgi:hypothetical protein
MDQKKNEERWVRSGRTSRKHLQFYFNENKRDKILAPIPAERKLLLVSVCSDQAIL